MNNLERDAARYRYLREKWAIYIGKELIRHYGNTAPLLGIKTHAEKLDFIIDGLIQQRRTPSMANEFSYGQLMTYSTSRYSVPTHDGDCYGDGTVYRGQRSKDSTMPTYTLNDLPELAEALRELEEQSQRLPLRAQA